MLTEKRLIFYHKHSVSGRTLFLKLEDTICQFEGISAASHVVESHLGGHQVKDDLSEILADAEDRLGMSRGSLTLDREFDVAVDDNHTPVQVLLARFTSLDPPADHLAQQSGKFIALTDARRLPPVELELLGLAYSTIMDDLS